MPENQVIRAARAFAFGLLMVAWAGISGCALVGNVKPVAEKSESYQIMDLAQANPDWMKLPQQAQAASDNASSDVAYQSQKTASIISLNSACRPSFAESSQNGSNDEPTKDLREFTDLLFLGISDVTLRQERNVAVQGTPALETTLKGRLNNEEMMLRTVVVRRQSCVYDLMYVARPDKFAANEADFSHFVASLRFL